MGDDAHDHPFGTRRASSVDNVELVAFDIGEGRPAGADALEVAELLRTEDHEAHGLGVQVVGDEVEVESLLRALRLGHLVERAPRSAVSRLVGGQDGVLRGGAASDLRAKNGASEPG